MKCGVQIVCDIITPSAVYPALFLTAALYSANKMMELQMQMMTSLTPTWLPVQVKLSYSEDFSRSFTNENSRFSLNTVKMMELTLQVCIPQI